jgi:hypothetical protein
MVAGSEERGQRLEVESAHRAQARRVAWPLLGRTSDPAARVLTQATPTSLTRDDNTICDNRDISTIQPAQALFLPRRTPRLYTSTTMAAIPATPSRFGASFSASQAQYNTDAPSMADTLPSIDFGFNDLRERMTQFTQRFDDFIERGRKRVLEERNAFRMNVAELEGTPTIPPSSSTIKQE